MYDMMIFMGIYSERLPIKGRRQETLGLGSRVACNRGRRKEEQEQKDESGALDG